MVSQLLGSRRRRSAARSVCLRASASPSLRPSAQLSSSGISRLRASSACRWEVRVTSTAPAVAAAGPLDHPGGVQALGQRGQGSVVESQHLGNLADRQCPALPQEPHNEVPGIGEARSASSSRYRPGTAREARYRAEPMPRNPASFAGRLEAHLLLGRGAEFLRREQDTVCATSASLTFGPSDTAAALSLSGRSAIRSTSASPKAK
jgi:hypothetical protein